ncbi:Uncharacterised protein [Citrobacter koseri]|uniref:Uncharacterized protein n=1 Tax=Citrobacter koseri TaxID=545 RepID=A0A2X2USH4_CITKO|nr:Uncharacterised protein [Citrobacter koseri]
MFSLTFSPGGKQLRVMRQPEQIVFVEAIDIEPDKMKFVAGKREGGVSGSHGFS